MNYPTRNKARALIYSTAELYRTKNTTYTVPTKEIVTYLVLWYLKKHSIDRTTFVFTNAMTDVYSFMTVNDENEVDMMIMVNNFRSALYVEEYFQTTIGKKIESVISGSMREDDDYFVKMEDGRSENLDLTWFDNSQNLVLQLISGYQRNKNSKGLLFLDNDIKQVIIDYTVVLCNNHFRQLGYLNKTICESIAWRLSKNYIRKYPCLADLNMIVHNVLIDLESSATIRSAYDFITKLY